MSSTTGNVVNNENYPTPIPVVEKLLEHLVLRPGDTFLEPCRGLERNIYDRINIPEHQKSWAELDEGVNYLETRTGDNQRCFVRETNISPKIDPLFRTKEIYAL